MAKKKTAVAAGGMEPGMVLAITIPALNRKILHLELEGDSNLIIHRWSTKAKGDMLAKQQGKAGAMKKKAVRDPQKEYEDSLYPMPDGKGYGFPSMGFKLSAINACRHLGKDIPMTLAKGVFHVNTGEELVKIEGDGPHPREDMVRIGQGTSDLRFRGEFRKWRAKLKIDYNADVFTAEQIVNLFQIAGFAVGVGEWRPGSPKTSGPFGMFHVATHKPSPKVAP